jgi:hypothetical protein
MMSDTMVSDTMMPDSIHTEVSWHRSVDILTIYLAGGMGAFSVAFGDIMVNGDAAAVNKISMALSKVFGWVPPEYGLPALAFLTLFGSMMCLVRQPNSRIDAFTVGSTVFAVLTAASPYREPNSLGPTPPSKTSSELRTQVAYAGHGYPFSAVHAMSFDLQTMPVTILPKYDEGHILDFLEVDVYSSTTRESLQRIWVAGGDSINLQLPPGEYRIELEGPGIQRTAATLNVGGGSAAYTVALQSSTVPMNLQKLVPAAQGKLVAELPVT